MAPQRSIVTAPVAELRLRKRLAYGVCFGRDCWPGRLMLTAGGGSGGDGRGAPLSERREHVASRECAQTVRAP